MDLKTLNDAADHAKEMTVGLSMPATAAHWLPLPSGQYRHGLQGCDVTANPVKM
jgi:hypothetical protein